MDHFVVIHHTGRCRFTFQKLWLKNMQNRNYRMVRLAKWCVQCHYSTKRFYPLWPAALHHTRKGLHPSALCSSHNFTTKYNLQKKKKKGKLTLKLTLQHKTIIRKHEYNIFWIGLPSFPSKRAADPRGSDSMIVFLCNATNDEPCIMDIVNKQLILPVHELIFWINTVYFKQITGCSHSQHQFSREITVHTQNIHKESSIYFHWRVYAILFPCALCVYVTRS